MIHQCQISELSAGKFKALLEEFYSDSPERLKVSLLGLSLTVKKAEQRPRAGLRLYKPW